MPKAIRIYETGGPEVMRWEDVDVGKPGERAGPRPAYCRRGQLHRHLSPLWLVPTRGGRTGSP